MSEFDELKLRRKIFNDLMKNGAKNIDRLKLIVNRIKELENR